MQDMTTFDKALKEDYQPVIREQVVNFTYYWSKIRPNTKDIDAGGRQAIIGVHLTRNWGVGARTGRLLPQAGFEGIDNLRIPLKRNYGRIALDAMVIQASRRDPFAFARAMKVEMTGLVNTFRLNYARQFYGSGKGVLATLTAAAAGVTTLSVSDARYFARNQRLDIYTPDGATQKADSVQVVNVNRAANQITVNVAVTAAAGDELFLEDSRNAEITGLDAIVNDTGTLYGLDRATIPELRAQVIDAGGGALSLDLLQQLVDEIEIEGGGQIGVLLTDKVQRRKYFGLVRADRRHVNTMTLDGGFKAVEFDGHPLIADRLAPARTVYGVSLESFEHYQMTLEPEWADDDGKVLKWIAGEDAYTAYLRWYTELAGFVPAHNGRLRNLAA